MAMDRRAFMNVLGAAFAMSPTRADAQRDARVRTVGVLMGLADDPEAVARTKVIELGLADRGWIVGQNLRLEYRFAAGDVPSMLRLSKELISLNPDVIVGHSTPVVSALLQATRTIPIVFVVVADPIGSGFATSLAHPGGNVTGFSNPLPTITGKYLSILRELTPELARTALMYNPDSIPGGRELFMPAFVEAATQFHVAPIDAEVTSTEEIEAVMTDLRAAPGGALVVMADNFTTIHRDLIIALAVRLRIPTIYPYRYFVDEGGLLSYGYDHARSFSPRAGLRRPHSQRRKAGRPPDSAAD
jgi:putative tryptophan/tyrosine transport system substrate-binding protein